MYLQETFPQNKDLFQKRDFTTKSKTRMYNFPKRQKKALNNFAEKLLIKFVKFKNPMLNHLCNPRMLTLIYEGKTAA